MNPPTLYRPASAASSFFMSLLPEKPSITICPSSSSSLILSMMACTGSGLVGTGVLWIADAVGVGVVMPCSGAMTASCAASGVQEVQRTRSNDR
jgi:hypothetical protein